MDCCMCNDMCVDYGCMYIIEKIWLNISILIMWFIFMWIFFFSNYGSDDWIYILFYNVLLCLEINGVKWIGYENSWSIMFLKLVLLGLLYVNWYI